MTIECLEDVTVRYGGQVRALHAGQTIDLPPEKARRLLERAAGRVRVLGDATQPIAPIKPGWFVIYPNREGKLCGGFDEREHGTVLECRWEGTGWTVHLTDGQRLSLSIIRGVGKPNGAGWTVKEHGYDGEGPIQKR